MGGRNKRKHKFATTKLCETVEASRVHYKS